MLRWLKFFNNERTDQASIKAIIFDFDGTLVDSFAFAVEKINSMAPEYGFAPLNDLQALRGKSMKQCIQEDLKLAFYQLPKFIKRLKVKVEEQELDVIKTVDGIKDTIEQLSKRYVLGIVTSNFSEVVNRILAKDGVDGFGFIYAGSSLFGKHTVFKRMLKEYQFKPSEVVYVGDELRDIKACRKVGIKMIAVSWGFNSRDVLQKEQLFGLIDQPSQLLSILEK